MLAVCERFGIPPWELEDAPADRVAYWFGVLGAEGAVLRELEGVGPDEQFYDAEPEG